MSDRTRVRRLPGKARGERGDLDAPVWAGVLPILTSYGDPEPAPDLRGDPVFPAYARGWRP